MPIPCAVAAVSQRPEVGFRAALAWSLTGKYTMSIVDLSLAPRHVFPKLIAYVSILADGQLQ